ncbi:MAG: exosome complex RNA-binding protein Rrp4 [Candidatus Njordarchaeales archaeon]
MPVFFKNMDIVVPGDLVAEGNYRIIEGAYRVGQKIFSRVVGVIYVREKSIKIVPLEGNYYIPKVGDHVIGKIVDYNPVSWQVDIRAPYLAKLDASDFLGRPLDPAKEDITRFLNVGDLIFAKVASADRASIPTLIAKGSNLGKITGGKIIAISPQKVPRVVGRNQSMIKLLQELTKATIRVGDNGLIWIRAKNKQVENIVVRAIKKIERESHVPKLTDRIRDFITEELKKIEGEEK